VNWLTIDGERLFTAQVQRLKGTYNFSSRQFIRAVGQYVRTDRNQSLYSFHVRQHSGTLTGSALYAYKLNWQSVLFVGFGDESTITETKDVLERDRQVFIKLSYAFQR
jgi:hypothetical protein